MKSQFKQLISLFVALLASLSLNAQTADTAAGMPTSLASTMKRMSSDLKKVAAQVNDPSLNTESEKLANDYVLMALHSKNFTPDRIANIPANQQPAQKENYDLTLDKTAETGKLLAQAFHDNENTKAVEFLNQLSKDKKDGHARFK